MEDYLISFIAKKYNIVMKLIRTFDLYIDDAMAFNKNDVIIVYSGVQLKVLKVYGKTWWGVLLRSMGIYLTRFDSIKVQRIK